MQEQTKDTPYKMLMMGKRKLHHKSPVSPRFMAMVQHEAQEGKYLQGKNHAHGFIHQIDGAVKCRQRAAIR